ncbi:MULTISPECIES: metalloregulator ArsR/SmtB family transcription factor [unclassified Pseudodesulfovibrio]|uniref:ArsR/SmtB family transcription factor n=1 Tax=unclassified Pseudodesulfovibrio TaxID=2661612 RepID=UPI000FEC1BCA|nr:MULTISPECIES: metalloregulator ArsR/SmtB family transcription factor [unclassified Pseudodesulfovibrio]MCJ2165442.1 helix-turn-helix domain-containing protein [Pseudodesulfovibrio sp. S3-i]RWU03192.1 ArsR family transcriptional regulator [Pseudodesulfovibrio sp. S3]
MSKTESENGSGPLAESELEQMSRMFKALSNPHRLRIYRQLSGNGSGAVSKSPEEFQNCQCGFAERFGLAPSTVSHHFKELREAGLIHMKRESKNVLVWVDREAARKLGCVLNG